SAPPAATPSVRPVSTASSPLPRVGGGRVGNLTPPPKPGPRGVSPRPAAARGPLPRAGKPPAVVPRAGSSVGGPPRPRPSSPQRSPGAAAMLRSAALAELEEARPASTLETASPSAEPTAPAEAPTSHSRESAVAQLQDEPKRPAEKPPVKEQDSALAGAFSAAVQAPGAGLDPAAGDEWFVGINGVPVGPIKLTELRSKAASGAVNKDSLVWRDGFEEWK